MRASRLLTPVALVVIAASPLLADWATERKAYLEAFQSRDAANRVSAVEGLKDADHAEGARLLLGHFSAEKDDRVVAALGRKICDLGSPEARETVKKSVLGESDGRRRAKLARMFAEGRGLDRVEILQKLLADRDPAVREAAATTLGTPDGLLTRFVAALATDPVPEVRKAAIGALGRIATLEAVEPLIVVVENETVQEIKEAALVSLRRITDRNYGMNPEAWRVWWRKHRAGDLTEVDRAIYLGAEYLRARLKEAMTPAPVRDPKRPPMLVGDLRAVPVMMYALTHAGVDPSDPGYKAGVEYLIKKPPDGTYNLALTALALADLDADKYCMRLAELAQILSDQQSSNGQWSYGFPGQVTISPPGKKEPPADEESGPGGGKKKGPRRKIPISWHAGPRGEGGDNSNTQFAILGLRATMEAGCEVPRQVWERSLDWFYKAQEKPYGGWGYVIGGTTMSMTCGGTCSITICLHALGKNEAILAGKPLEVVQIKNGVDWLDKNWMDLNPKTAAFGHGGGWGFYYQLYSLERVGMIVGLEKIGEHDWYAEGRDGLLAAQGDNGAWGENPIDTAFAILFLKRATRGFEISPQDEK
ncbi:MAG: HEAT repeat domain-containing protein [Planctomycetota bacterium]